MAETLCGAASMSQKRAIRCIWVGIDPRQPRLPDAKTLTQVETHDGSFRLFRKGFWIRFNNSIERAVDQFHDHKRTMYHYDGEVNWTYHVKAISTVRWFHLSIASRTGASELLSHRKIGPRYLLHGNVRKTV